MLRRSYIFFFLIWLAAISSMFVSAVWGNFDDFAITVNKQMAYLYVQGSNLASDAYEKTSQEVKETSEELKKDIGTLKDEAVYSVRKRVLNKANEETHYSEDAIKRAYKEATMDIQKVVQEVEQPQPSSTMPKEPKPEQFDFVAKAEPDFRSTGVVKSSNIQTGQNILLFHLDVASAPDEKITYFWAEGRKRLAVDLRGEWKTDLNSVTRVKDSFVDAIIMGRHKDRLRFVFTFNDKQAPKGLVPIFSKAEDSIDITLTY